jgi:chromosome segregation ATPase
VFAGRGRSVWLMDPRRCGSWPRTKRLESQLADAESECARLSRTLDQVKAERERIQVEATSRREEIERELGMIKNELEVAKSKIRLYADYDEIKRELEIMKVRMSIGNASGRMGTMAN